MEHSKNLIKLIAVLALMTAGSVAHAVAITLDPGDAVAGGINFPFGPGDLGTTIVDAEVDRLDITKGFFDGSTSSFGGTFDNSLGTEFVDVSESVTNNSVTGIFDGGDWLDYHIEIAFTLSSLCIANSVCRDGVVASGITNTGFSNPAALSTTLNATGGIIMIDFTGGTIASEGGTFDIDFQLQVRADDGPISFTISQYPTMDGGSTSMPEPTTLALLGLGLAGLGAGRRQKA